MVLNERKQSLAKQKEREKESCRSWQIKFLKQSSSSFCRTLSTDGVIERMVATTKKLLLFLERID
jgi:hypothetical protein